MKQEIIIRRDNYVIQREYETDNKLNIEYIKTQMNQYEKWQNFLHIQVGEYDDFNLYIEMNEFQIEDMIKNLQKQLKKVRYGH